MATPYTARTVTIKSTGARSTSGKAQESSKGLKVPAEALQKIKPVAASTKVVAPRRSERIKTQLTEVVTQTVKTEPSIGKEKSKQKQQEDSAKVALRSLSLASNRILATSQPKAQTKPLQEIKPAIAPAKVVVPRRSERIKALGIDENRQPPKEKKSKPRATGSSGFYGRAAGVKATVTNENGEVVEAKTSMAIQKGTFKVEKGHEGKVHSMIAARIKSHRPIEQFIRKKGEVVAAQTPGKSILPVHEKLYDGAVITFRQESFSPESKEKKSTISASPALVSRITDQAKFDASSPAKAVIKRTKIKLKEIIITPELLKQSEIEIRKNKGRRSISQNKLKARPGVSEKKAGATGYARATGEFPEELKWEWLHFIAHKILASKAQNEENLGCGTDFSNTEMMFVEYQIPELAEAYPNGFKLKVEPEFIPNTQILKKIRYTVITDDFILPFVFNAQLHHRPSLLGYKYTGAFVTTMIKLRNGTVVTPTKPVDQYPKTHLFYTPRKLSMSPAATTAASATTTRKPTAAACGR